MKFKNGREIKDKDAVHGLDHAGRLVAGTALKGDKEKGQRDFIFQHGAHKTVCPSLNLENFLHSECAGDVKTIEEFHKACAKPFEPAAPTGTA
jgi:hypothetical protein